MGTWVASELQLSLLALAAAFVFLVWIYNKWQEYRQQRIARKIFSGERGDALAADVAAEEPPPRVADERIEPTIAGAAEDDAGPGDPPLDLADPGIDCLVRLRPREELAAPVFWQAQRERLDGFVDTLRWLGWQHGQWRQLTAHDAGSCRCFVGVQQLADRSGPVGEAMLEKLWTGVAQLAEAIGAEADLPSLAAVLEQARELDDFCASVDWRISLNLVGRGGAALDGAALRGMLQNDAFRQAESGEMQALDAAGQTQFLVCGLGGLPLPPEEQLAGISLIIDVPLVTDGLAAFDRLQAFAQALMAAQNGQLVDDQKAPLSEETLAAIRAKIAEFQEKMRASELPAGGRRALRLYA